jgi:hypothetical protein
VPHRLRLVAEREGVRVSDSKATNVAAARRALAAYADGAGASDRRRLAEGRDFGPLAGGGRPANVRSVHLISAEAGRLADDRRPRRRHA